MTLLLIALVLSLASLIGQLAVHLLDDFPVKGTLIRLSDVSNELSVATWFSSSVLALCAVLLAVITLAKRSNGARNVFQWMTLSLIFLCLSVDEAAAIHEASIGRIQSTLSVGGFLYYSWVIPGAALTAVLALVYVRFIGALPPDIRRLVLVGAALFVGGALGVELVGGWLADSYGEETMRYAVASNAEELLEMVGIIVFFHALMLYFGLEVGEMRARFSPSR